MIGKVWAIMIASSFFCAVINNKMNELGNAILEGTDQAINIILMTSGAIIFWSGIMKIAQDSGFTGAISKLLFPILRVLFPNCAKKWNILNPICINFVSNIMGLSNAATPSGIKAMQESFTNKRCGIFNHEYVMYSNRANIFSSAKKKFWFEYAV